LRRTVKKYQLRHQVSASCDQLFQPTWIAGGGEFQQSEGPYSVVLYVMLYAIICTHTELLNDLDSA